MRNAGRADLLEAAETAFPRHLRRVIGAETEGAMLDPRLMPSGLSMTGRRRLDRLRDCVELVLDHGVPGDLVECGVWRGGLAMMMAGVLAARGVTDRKVWLADSFEGLPRMDGERDFSADVDLLNTHGLAVTEATVRASFEELGLMGDNIRFLPGWFGDTLPSAPVERIAVLRLDGDLYTSTMDAFEALYDRLSPGGFVIVDHYALPPCAEAVAEFRKARGIVEPIERIDHTGILWRKLV